MNGYFFLFSASSKRQISLKGRYTVRTGRNYTDKEIHSLVMEAEIKLVNSQVANAHTIAVDYIDLKNATKPSLRRKHTSSQFLGAYDCGRILNYVKVWCLSRKYCGHFQHLCIKLEYC